MTESIYNNSETPVILKQQLFHNYSQSFAIKNLQIGRLKQKDWIGLRQALYSYLKRNVFEKRKN